MATYDPSQWAGESGGVAEAATEAQHSPRMSGLLLEAVLSVLGVMLVGCGSTTDTTTNSTSVPTATTAASTPTPTATAAPTGALSGIWSGQYSGAYQGTFTLTWQQTGSNLSGTIKLSAPPATLGITGSVQGTAITFGVVGGVTYSGSAPAAPCPAPTRPRTAGAALGAPPRRPDRIAGGGLLYGQTLPAADFP